MDIEAGANTSLPHQIDDDQKTPIAPQPPHLLEVVGLDTDDVTEINEDASSEVSAEEIDGVSCEIKNLYEGPKKCKCCINWVDELPEEELEPLIEEAPKTKRCALLVRHRRHHRGGSRRVAVDSIVVQSPYVKPVLEKVFEGYAGVTASLKYLIFRAPFHEWFHVWPKMEEAMNEEHDRVTANHLQLLYSVLKKELQEKFDTYNDLISNGVITYDYLWTIFKPGELIYAPKVGGFERLFKLKDTDFLLACQLTCTAVDWSGCFFGWTTLNYQICPFWGTKPICELDFYPFRFALDRGAVERRLLARGRRFEGLSGIHYKAYRGLTLGGVRRHDDRDDDEPHWAETDTKKKVEGRVVVDAQAYNSQIGGQPPVTPFFALDFSPTMSLRPDSVHVPKEPGWTMVSPPGIPGMPPPLAPDVMGLPCPPPPPPPPGRGYRVSPRRPKSCGPPRLPPPPPPMDMVEPMFDCDGSYATSEASTDSDQKDGLTDEKLMMCTPEVKGFSLKTKDWVKLCVDNIQDVEWNNKIFDNLVLPGGYKDLILSFVESQATHKEEFDDFVEGKGQGIVFLLHGEPGVGKTLTAEAIAERLRTPLYSLSAGDLGDSAASIEASLNGVLDSATRWGAVALLDEADVFLEQRRLDSLERNKIVAVFLRVLEHYRGTLFLTTNRLEAFDKAFQSRVHLRINYPPLGEEARRGVWRNFLGTVKGECGVREGDLGALGRVELNGREIKNCVKTAQLLAKRQGRPLGVEHVKTVLRATQAGKMEG